MLYQSDQEAVERRREASRAAGPLERRGRRWLIASFLLCPCHLPVTLGILATVLGGTAAGAVLRDHGLVAGLVIAAAWLLGTARGLLLIRRGEREGFACAVRTPTT